MHKTSTKKLGRIAAMADWIIFVFCNAIMFAVLFNSYFFADDTP